MIPFQELLMALQGLGGAGAAGAAGGVGAAAGGQGLALAAMPGLQGLGAPQGPKAGAPVPPGQDPEKWATTVDRGMGGVEAARGPFQMSDMMEATKQNLGKTGAKDFNEMMKKSTPDKAPTPSAGDPAGATAATAQHQQKMGAQGMQGLSANMGGMKGMPRGPFQDMSGEQMPPMSEEERRRAIAGRIFGG